MTTLGLRQAVHGWLEELGGTDHTSSAVYQSLKDAGIKGRVGSPNSCPIAVYLNGRLDQEFGTSKYRASIGMRMVAITEYGDYMTTVSLPAYVASFIVRFDMGTTLGFALDLREV